MKTKSVLCILVIVFLTNFGAAASVFSEETKDQSSKRARYEYPPDSITLGLQFLEKQKYNEAAAIFEDVIREDPASLSGYICLANAYKNLREHAKVIETYQKGIQALLKQKKLTSEDLSGDASILSARLAEEYATLRKKDEAIDAAHKAIELTPKDPTDYMTLGWIYKSFGDKNKARESFEAALTLARSTDSKILIGRIERTIREINQ